jgi:hypothetical protein
VARHCRIPLLLIPTLKTTTSRHVLESRPSDSEALNAAILWTGNYLWQYVGFSRKTKILVCHISPDVKRQRHSIRHLAIQFSCTFTIKCIRLLDLCSLLLQKNRHLIFSTLSPLTSNYEHEPIPNSILTFTNSYMLIFLHSSRNGRFAMPPPSLLQPK